jgi:hypothetical protein
MASNRNRRNPHEISYTKTSTRKEIRRSESFALSIRRLPALGTNKPMHSPKSPAYMEAKQQIMSCRSEAGLPAAQTLRETKAKRQSAGETRFGCWRALALELKLKATRKSEGEPRATASPPHLFIIPSHLVYRIREFPF